MPKKKSKSATRSTAANRKHLAATQAQFKKLESRLAALDVSFRPIVDHVLAS